MRDSTVQVTEQFTILLYPGGRVRKKRLVTQETSSRHAIAQFSRYSADTSHTCQGFSGADREGVDDSTVPQRARDLRPLSRDRSVTFF